MKKHILLTLVLALLLTLVPFGAQAAETPSQTEVLPFHANPLYEGFSAVPAKAPEITVTESKQSQTLQASGYVSFSEAVTQLRSALRTRTTTVDIYVEHSSGDYEAVANDLLTEAMAHTGNPTEGDYLLWQFYGWGGEVYYEYLENGNYGYQFLLNLEYYTTAAQENELNTAVKNLLSSLGVSSMTDYQKVKAVYDYMIQNIVYDEAHLNDETYTLQFTAYAALVNKTAVCQGYATLLYRLMLEMGIDCRIIAGETENGGHAWNIVKLGDVYYNLDATWDAGYDDYAYFLRNSEGFADHYRYLDYMTTQFHMDYPMSETDYVDGVAGQPEQYFAYGMCGDDAYFAVGRDGVLTILGTGSTYDYLQSTTPGQDSGEWRYWEDGITAVVIDEGITKIGNSSFYGMKNIKRIQLPSTLELLGDYAFSLTSITSVVLPDVMTTVGFAAFDGCEKLASVTFGKNLKTIEAYAFCNNISLKSIDLPEGLEVIDGSAFEYCNSLTEVTIPSTVTYLSGFSGCENLKTVNLKNKHIGSYAFASCPKLENLILPEGLLTIESAAFQYCHSLTEVIIPSTVETTGSSAFQYCEGLKKVVIQNTTVDTYSFNGCTALETVEFGPNVELISICAFDYCSGLKELWFSGDLPDIGDYAFRGVTATAYYPADNATWTEDKLQNYGGTLTWVSTHVHDLSDAAPVYNPDTKTHVYDCLTCDVAVSETCTFIPAITTDASVTEAGVTTYTCSVCGGSYETYFYLRLMGSNRYETSILAADQLKIELGIEKFENIIVASGTGFADALAGSYLAVCKNAPILLVNKNTTSDVADYIEANLADRGTVYLLGGEAAVPAAMEDLLDGLNVKRLAGSNRYATNLEILVEAGFAGQEILVCTGNGFADSLSASAVGKPILLVNKSLTADQKEFLESTSGEFVIIGGEGAVSAAVETALKEYGPVERLAGANRYETSVLVAEKFFEAPTSAVVAYSQNFPDGLCGGPLAYATDSPLLLMATNRGDNVIAYANEVGIACGAVLGGTGLIDDATARNLFAMN